MTIENPSVENLNEFLKYFSTFFSQRIIDLFNVMIFFKTFNKIRDNKIRQDLSIDDK